MALSSFSTPLVADSNTFEDWLARTNALSSAMANNVITTGNNNVGDVELTGNVTVTAIITDTIDATANLAITPTTVFGNDVYVVGDEEITGSLLINGTQTRIYTNTLTVTANSTFSGASVDIQNKLYFGGNNYVYGTANNGIGIKEDMYVGGNIYVSESVILSNTSPFIYASPVYVNGGLSANSGTIAIDGNLVLSGTLGANSGVLEIANEVTVEGSLTANGDLTVTGDIVVSGNVDGRDIATDGALLDSIAASSYETNANNVLEALKNADPDAKAPSVSDKVFIQDASNSDVIFTSTTQQIADLAGGVPIGTILPWIGGYFGNGLNGSFVDVLGNDANTVNAALNGSGWYVCDGSEINVSESTIFNGSGRYLPNLTDDRFLMGDTAGGSTGGSSSSAHTHSIDVPAYTGTSGSTSLSTSQLASHDHSSLVQSGAYTPDDNGGPQLNIPGQASGDTGNTGSGNSHSHSMNHDHAAFTSGAASVTENRPKYLSVFYLMKVV